MNDILRYQELDSKIKKIELDLNNSEERKRGRQYTQLLKDAEDGLKKMEKRAEDLIAVFNKNKAMFEDSKDLITEYSKAVNSSKDNDELNYLQKKLSELIKNYSAIEKDILNISNEIERTAKSFDDYKIKYPKYKIEYARYKDEFEKLRLGKLPEVSEIKSEMLSLEKDLDAVLVDKFKKLKAQGIYPPFVQLIGSNQCGGCRMEIPLGQVAKLNTVGYMECESCHRILLQKK